MEAMLPGSDRPDRRFRYTNLILVVLQIFGGGVVATVMGSRDSYRSLSEAFFGSDALLMGSWLADLLVRDEAIVLVVGIVLLGIWKEFLLRSATLRLVFNLAGIATLMALHGVLVYLLYAPIGA